MPEALRIVLILLSLAVILSGLLAILVLNSEEWDGDDDI